MLETYQQCRSLDGWVPVYVRSTTDPDKGYLVMVTPWGQFRENVCECKGYHYRGECKHQVIARRQICGWSQMAVQAEEQDTQQRKEMICPRCLGSTMWTFRIKDEDE